MSYLIYNTPFVPSGPRKLLYVNWILVVLISTVVAIGLLMLYSLAGGSVHPWAQAQFERFVLGLSLMLIMAMVPPWFWRNMAFLGYGTALLLLALVQVIGVSGGGAQRWLDLGVVLLQPSELMKLALVVFLAAYYDWLPADRVSRPLWLCLPLAVIGVPTAMTLAQPDLGTAVLMATAGLSVMFIAGVHWGYFAVLVASAAGVVGAVFESRGTPWQLLKDYQYKRIDTFLDPGSDPLGAGYHTIQAQIALGSGGIDGRGFMNSTQSNLHFLPEPHTDFIFTALGEEFGFIGTATLLLLYGAILVTCFTSALLNSDRFGAICTLGLAVNFFLYFAINMAMVMGLAPVVGVPLPLVSYGGSAMLVLMLGFGLIQSAHVHRPR